MTDLDPADERPPLFDGAESAVTSPADETKALAKLLGDQRFGFSDEDSLQAAIAAALAFEGWDYQREFILDPANRLDFLVDRVAIEVKIAGPVRELMAQVERYSLDERVTGVVVVTTITGHMAMPGFTSNGTPVEVVYLSSTNGRAVPATKVHLVPDTKLGSIRRKDKHWAVYAKPHIMTRVRRLFPRVRQGKDDGGAALIPASEEAARDLEMLRFRYDLEMTADDAALLTMEAQVHRERAEAVASILSGGDVDVDTVRVMAIPARWPCQDRNADLISTVYGTLIGDKLGRGKTYSGLTALRNPDALPAVVVCPPHLAPQWERETRRFWPGLKVHVAQKVKPYQMVEQPDVLIIPYSKIAGWAHTVAGEARTVIFDEMQHLRNGPASLVSKGSQRGDACLMIANLATYRVGLTGTPVYNYGGDMFWIMSYLRPELLGDRDEFIREWCGQAENGKTVVRDPDALAEYLMSEGAFTADPGDPGEKPERIEHVVESDRAEFDRIVANASAMAESMLHGSSREERFSASGQFEMWMRQATGIAKAPYVATFTEMLLEDGVEKVCLVGYHREVYKVWEKKLGHYGIAWYTGTETAAVKDRNFDRFVNGSDRIMVMSLASGEGVDGLQMACSVVVFGELDWSPAIPTQIIGRFDRPGQVRQVLAYFLTSDDPDGCDPHMLNTLGVKDRQGAPFNNHGVAVGHLGGGNGPMKDQYLREMAERVLKRGGGGRLL